MDRFTKDRLEALQAEIKLEAGVKATQQEILERLVDRAYQSKEEFIDSFREKSVPLTDEEIEKFHENISDWGIETGEEEIDEILYGAKRGS